MVADEVIEAMRTSAGRYRTLRLTATTPATAWRYFYDREAGARVEHEDVSLDTLYEVSDGRPGAAQPPDAGFEPVDGDVAFGSPVGASSPSPLPLLLDPARLVREAELTVGRTTTVAGRQGVHVSARFRHADGPRVVTWSGAGRQPTLDVVVDVERGVVLAGPDVEVREIAFDEAIDPALLRQWPRRGHAVLQRPVALLSEAAAAVPWPALIPARLPVQATFVGCSVSTDQPTTRLDALWYAVVELARGAGGPTVVPPALTTDVPTTPPDPWNPPVLQGDATVEVMLKQGPQVRRLHDRIGWEPVVVDGQPMRTVDRFPDGVSAVVVEREGVAAVVSGALPVSLLVEVAASLSSRRQP